MNRLEHRPAAALTDREVAYGVPLGYNVGPPLDRASTAMTPRQALEGVLTEALRRQPCAVSFSGGRDSSALLAIATIVARREGLPDPVPVTLRFPESVEADEDEWQALVLDRLHIDEWIRIDVRGDDFDAVGPVAQRALRRHGLLWPFNTHFHLPVVEAVRGGSLVTGFGGDEVSLSSESARAEQVLARLRRPGPADVLTVGLALSPRPLRAAVHRHRFEAEAGGLPWLTDTGLRAIRSESATASADIPLGWDRVLRRAIWRSRYFSVCKENFDAIGAASEVHVHHPFVAAPVLSALGTAGQFGGVGSRTKLMELLCGNDLPDRVVRRRTKGTFSSAVWTDTSRAFALRWSGEGVNRELVDVDALRKHWMSERVNLLSTTLLQAAWLHDNPNRTASAPGPTADAPSSPKSRYVEESGHGFINA
ncbi:MAG TPA: asparagine synthase-related protein [Acidothermaceae bacterium]|jgi:hypothetical protein|nr:asparagine synthase-related protein [Acidothermaceae bacterium]